MQSLAHNRPLIMVETLDANVQTTLQWVIPGSKDEASSQQHGEQSLAPSWGVEAPSRGAGGCWGTWWLYQRSSQKPCHFPKADAAVHSFLHSSNEHWVSSFLVRRPGTSGKPDRRCTSLSCGTHSAVRAERIRGEDLRAKEMRSGIRPFESELWGPMCPPGVGETFKHFSEMEKTKQNNPNNPKLLVNML